MARRVYSTDDGDLREARPWQVRDHRDTVVEVLRAEGYDVVLAGG